MNRLFSSAAVGAVRVILLAAAGSCGMVLAQTYPDKSIRILVPFPPGGGGDIFARTIGNKLAEKLGWSIAVENKPGANGALALGQVAKATPDGYTLAIATVGNVTIVPAITPKLSYDTRQDLVPVAPLGSGGFVILVSAKSGYKTLGDVIADARKRPEALSMATPGNGTQSHLIGEMLQAAAGVKFLHVPYKGSPPAIVDLIGERIDVFISSVPTVSSAIATGNIRPIAVTGTRREAQLPDVPTIAESGYKGFNAAAWWGMFAPKGTPQAIVTRLNEEVALVLRDADVQKSLAANGTEVMFASPTEFAAFFNDEYKKWGDAARSAGIKLD